MAGHVRALWQKVELMRRFPVDEYDDASDSDDTDADPSEQEAATGRVAAHAEDVGQLVSRVEAVEDEVLVLKTRAAEPEAIPRVRVVDSVQGRHSCLCVQLLV